MERSPVPEGTSPDPVGTGAKPVAQPVAQPDASAGAQAEIDRLRAELAAARVARELALDELLALQDALSRATALCDMADWAAEVAAPPGGPAEPVVRVDDLRHALRREP